MSEVIAWCIAETTSSSATFTPTVSGTYVVRLTVTNLASTSTSTVTISTVNSAPVANAGPNQTAAVGATVQLTGAASSDVDGDSLTYKWTLASRPTGSTASLSSTTIVNPTIRIDKPGSYSVQLIVNDGKADSNVSTINISTVNSAPVANAGPAQTVSVNSVVQLDGSASTDVDGDSLTYAWNLNSKPDGSAASLSSTTIVNPTFRLDKPGTYVAQLIVNDGTLASAAATVTISTNAVQAPTANPGTAQTVRQGATVTLRGGGTDPQNLPLTYLWSLASKPDGSNAALSSTTAQNPTFAVDKTGNYVAQLIVNNGFLSSAPVTVTITTTGSAPIANAGAAQTAFMRATVSASPRASMPRRDAISWPFRWMAW